MIAYCRLAQDRLVNADRALRAQVLALLDVRVSVLEHPADGPVRLRVEGSVAHDVLLRGVEPDVAPAVLATGRR